MQISKKFNLKKATLLAIVVNGIQILCALGILFHALFSKSFSIPERAEIILVVCAAAVVIWGAIVDIRDAFITRQIDVRRQMLEEAYARLESLNSELRAQRHDFKNHLQVVYSLNEMQAYSEAMDYVKKVYADVHALGRYLRTSIPAVNAILSAKAADCEERGIEFTLDIRSAWEEMPMPGWEMCRILGNLIDNAIDALHQTPQPRISVSISEDINAWKLCVENNGAEIPEELRSKILLQGFSTKGENRGSGLSIVHSLLQKYAGTLRFSSEWNKTCFFCEIRKRPSA